VDTPLGYRVVLSRDRWYEIVRFKHPAVTKGIKKGLELWKDKGVL
jgi:hypothetical protein